MPSENRTPSVSTAVQVSAASLPQHADAKPLDETSTHVPGRRLTTRELARRRRQRLLELLQQQEKSRTE
jgi:hypothetical protein